MSDANNKMITTRTRAQGGVVLAALILTSMASVVLARHQPARLDDLPATVSDTEFWRLVTELSEPDGRFQAEYMSNEDSAQFVIPALKQTTRTGGVYLGVGPEQNF